jgi:hypothetical protein
MDPGWLEDLLLEPLGLLPSEGSKLVPEEVLDLHSSFSKILHEFRPVIVAESGSHGSHKKALIMECRVERVATIIMVSQGLDLMSVRANSFLYHPGTFPGIGGCRRTCNVQGFKLELGCRLL